jgi:hypothetical protein
MKVPASHILISGRIKPTMQNSRLLWLACTAPDMLNIEKFNYKKLVKMSNKKYRDMSGASCWTPETTIKQSWGKPSLPAVIQCSMRAMMANLKQQGFIAKPVSTGSDNKTKISAKSTPTPVRRKDILYTIVLLKPQQAAVWAAVQLTC